MKVVINNCFGGFGLSPEATLELWKRGGPVEATPVAEYFGKRDADDRFGLNEQLKAWREYLATPRQNKREGLFVTVFTPDETKVLYLGRAEEHRANPILVQLIEEAGEAANGSCAKLKIVEIPDDAEWEIAEYDGNEHVAEKHRSWG